MTSREGISGSSQSLHSVTLAPPHAMKSLILRHFLQWRNLGKIRRGTEPENTSASSWPESTMGMGAQSRRPPSFRERRFSSINRSCLHVLSQTIKERPGASMIAPMPYVPTSCDSRILRIVILLSYKCSGLPFDISHLVGGLKG